MHHRLWGPGLLRNRWVARFLPPEKKAQIEANFQKHGIRILLYVRWLPGIRAPMFVTAGTMRLDFRRFVVADGLSSMIGHTVFADRTLLPALRAGRSCLESRGVYTLSTSDTRQPPTFAEV